MRAAIGRISAGRLSGIPLTHSFNRERGIRQASSSVSPRTIGARAASDRRLPPQSGQGSSRRNFSTRFIPFSSLTLDRAFSTVRTALK